MCACIDDSLVPSTDKISSLLKADFSHILAYLEELTKKQQLKVGVMLGLSHSRLMRMSDDTLLVDMVHAWLQREDDVIEWSGLPTWDRLAEALQELGHKNIALDIKQGT